MTLSTLVLFRGRFGLARLKEFESVAERLFPNIEIDWNWDATCRSYYGGDYGPSTIQRLPSALSASQWAEVGARCIGCKSIFQIVGWGETLKDCIEDVGRWSNAQILDLIQGTWSMQIKLLGRSDRLHPKERRNRIESFRDVLGVLVERTVQLENPDHELVLLEDYRRLEIESEAHDPAQVWLLHRMCPNEGVDIRELAERSDVKSRAFIHTTTLSSERALLMTNLAKLNSNRTMLDPFCGSGGLLLAGSLLGATVRGSDIDEELLLHKDRPVPFPKSPKRPLRGVEKVSYGDSFHEQGVVLPTLIPGLSILDETAVSQWLNANDDRLYDAIVTDPPYGIRESNSHLSQVELLRVLLQIGERVLNPSGRIVLLYVDDGSLDDIATVQKRLKAELESVFALTTFELLMVSVEPFNRRSCRATIVCQRQGNC